MTPKPNMTPRKPLERDYNCRMKGTEEIVEYVETMITDYFKAFPEVDCTDLMIILQRHGGYRAVRENIAFYDV